MLPHRGPKWRSTILLITDSGICRESQEHALPLIYLIFICYALISMPTKIYGIKMLLKKFYKNSLIRENRR